MDDWTIHDRTEFPVQKVTTITKLKWGVNFTVKHGAGIPAELLRAAICPFPSLPYCPPTRTSTSLS